MIKDPFVSLLHSRKFLILVLDVATSIILYYFGGEDVKFLIAAIQPVIVMIIYAIAKEDAAAKGNTKYPFC